MSCVDLSRGLRAYSLSIIVCLQYLYVLRVELGILMLHVVQEVVQWLEALDGREGRQRAAEGTKRALLGHKQKVDPVPRIPSRSRRRSQNATRALLT